MISAAAVVLMLATTEAIQCGPEHYALVDNMSELIVFENPDESNRMYRQPTGKAIVALDFNQAGKLIQMKVVCSTSQLFEKVALRYVKNTKFNIPSTAKRSYKMAITVKDADK